MCSKNAASFCGDKLVNAELLDELYIERRQVIRGAAGDEALVDDDLEDVKRCAAPRAPAIPSPSRRRPGRAGPRQGPASSRQSIEIVNETDYCFGG